MRENGIILLREKRQLLSGKEETIMEELEFRYDTQLLIDGEDLDEDEIAEYITENFEGDSLLFQLLCLC